MRDKIEGRIRETHGGQLTDPRFGVRMCGTGEMGKQIRELSACSSRKHGLDGDLPDYDCSRFRPPQHLLGTAVVVLILVKKPADAIWSRGTAAERSQEYPARCPPATASRLTKPAHRKLDQKLAYPCISRKAVE